MENRLRILIVGILLGCILCLPRIAMAIDPEAKRLLDLGRFELERDCPEEALSYFNSGLQVEPDSIPLQVARTQALVKMQCYAEAEAELLSMIQCGGDAQKAAHVELGALYGRTKRYQEALEQYSCAIELMPKRADLYLARGSMYMELGDYCQAEAEFDQAVCVNNKLASLSLYYKAINSNRQEDFVTTKARLDEALTFCPDDRLAESIQKFKDSVIKEEKSLKFWSVYATPFVQYDDNVSMEPDAGWTSFGGQSSGKRDWNEGLRTTATLYFLNKRHQKTGLDYVFRGQFYHKLTQYDNITHSLDAFYQHDFVPWYFRISAGASHYTADGKEAAHLYSLTPYVARVWGERDRSQFVGYYMYKNNRDGNDNIHRYVLDTLHFHTFIKPKTAEDIGLTARAGLRFEHENPEGSSGYKYWLWEPMTGVTFPLPYQFEGDLGASYAFAHFGRNDTLALGKNRNDTRLTLQAKLGRKVNDYLRADIQWIYTRNDSNLDNNQGNDLYEFKRNVYTFLITGKF